MPDVIFIAGYYRSGTSALSGALQRLGVTLHNDAEANEHNPLGYFEIPELIEFDVELFGRLGVEWTDVRGLPAHWPERADMAPFLSRLEEILRRRFAAEALWALKHPHLCRLLPLYLRAVRQAGHRPHVIHIMRDPWVVADSQARKNNLSRAHAVLLWVSYVTEAERLARDLPRAWLTYDALLRAPQAALRGIGDALGLDFGARDPAAMASACGFLAGELNRSAQVKRDGVAPVLLNLVEEVWAAAQAGNPAAADWDEFGRRCSALTGLVAELGASRGLVVPGFGVAGGPVVANAAAALRPAERTDEGARRRLAVRAAAAALPRVAVLVAAPPRRAHAIGDSLASLDAQWRAPDFVKIVSVDPAEIAGRAVRRAPEEAGALTRVLCAEVNEAASHCDYVALLNAGDTVAPDAIQRFALLAADEKPDVIYCDEVVPGDRASWVRHKPAWDVTRLRQSAYLGDWVWYRGAALLRAGGFDDHFAGVEEYEAQLRLAEGGARVARLPEALFMRAKLSRRDNIPATVFGQLALDAVTAHLRRAGIGGAVTARTYLGLFQHRREVDDPGTAIVLLCDHAELESLNDWTQSLLSGPELTGRLVLTAERMAPAVLSYLTQVAAASQLHGKVCAAPARAGFAPGEALQRALALAASPHVAIVDAAAAPASPDWLAGLRARLADPAVAVVSGRSLVRLAKDASRFMVQGPVIRGADARLGAGHLADDPGPGGWLAVDQAAGVVAPGGILARREALAGVRVAPLAGDALWIDVCAQIRAGGGKIVWTPDVSFVCPPASIRPDFVCAYRAGSKAARALPAGEEYHHQALSLRGDLLAAEQKFGLVAAAPADPADLLLSGAPEAGFAVLNAARALRMAGKTEAGWAPEPMLPAEWARRAPSAWVRINPQDAGHGARYAAVFTRPPNKLAPGAVSQAAQLYATSPALAALVQQAAPGRKIQLWRPALSQAVWRDFAPAGGLNTKPRVLWIDEGFAPDWLPALIRDTAGMAAWIIVERAGAGYGGEVARLAQPADEQAWARELASLSPHVLVRPAEAAYGDQYAALLAAASGCALMVDERLDLPATLTATRLGNTAVAWRAALEAALSDLPAVLAAGAAARQACLALPSVEDAAPGWAGPLAGPAARRAVA